MCNLKQRSAIGSNLIGSTLPPAGQYTFSHRSQKIWRLYFWFDFGRGHNKHGNKHDITTVEKLELFSLILLQIRLHPVHMCRYTYSFTISVFNILTRWENLNACKCMSVNACQ